MLETLFVTLIVAAVTGLSILAYRHPAAYMKLHSPLVLLGIFVFSGCALWSIAMDFAELSIARVEIPSVHMSQVRETLRDQKVPFGWAFLSFFAYQALLIFLAYLPRLLEVDESGS